MNPLLIYFKEDCIELWSLDNNGRLLPVLYNSSNQLPLYFLISGDQILMDNYAKDSFLSGSKNSFGDFWRNIENNSLNYDRFAIKNSFATLLPYVFKESVLPSIVKSHFHTNLSDFLTQSNTAVIFDTFVEEQNKEIILKLFFEIIGFDPNSILSIDFFNCFRNIQTKCGAINQSDSFILANISNDNFYFHLIGKNSPLHLAKKVLQGKGQDPVLDIVLDFLVEIAMAKGSALKHADIKKELKNDAKIILNKIPDGLVIHTIKNNNIDVNPLKISFHKNDIEGRINNRQSLNFIQNEFDSFRRQNNAEQLPIFLSGTIINQSVFKEFFNATYSKVNFENNDFSNEFILHCLTKILAKENTNAGINTPPIVKTPPKVNTPPVLNTPPKITAPPNLPPKVTAPPILNTPPKVMAPPPLPPKVTAPQVVNSPPKVSAPPPLPPKVAAPPPPPSKVVTPPPPPIKKSVPPPPPIKKSVPPPPPTKKK
jgi:hypothetical protein